MKINDVNRLQGLQSYKNTINITQKQDLTKKIQVDKVEFSQAAQEKISVEKEQRIQALKEQIQNGTYKVDSEKIAEKLLSTWSRGPEE
ncbi:MULTISPECIES: flagellar biosynthesis anti-sigma factor FlgM [Neobacillus]|jgi:negative regulator of flagellin synthesis FlgM|uniref:flagellar biosynthesis anti-sigma factor FlgM n=1 Tax=Neobacillus TaxID=2675232 RepID=UPI000BF56EEB|nr:flagellar biosynthesis anti-sigma factor FlgM [Neobacillus sp. OS1-33]PEQ82436.1 flagellar biosynthesis anti-sigma factor FlgM [Bacillus sp. AFS006103]WML24750.1 flagellar biosynthesis anti-sigma factor FlgM [Neobacillus sp. OS1-33]